MRRALFIALCALFTAAAVLWGLALRRPPPPPKGPDAKPGVKRTLVYEGRKVPYYVDGRDFIIDSFDFAPEVKGFAGPLRLSLRLAPSGKLKDFVVIESSETPEYLESALANKEVYSKDGEAVPVSGATFSSQAILNTIQASSSRFMAALSKSPAPAASNGLRVHWDYAGLALIAFAALALVLRHLKRRPSRWVRLFFLGATVLLFGVCFKLQLSMDRIADLLLWRAPEAGLTGAFLLFALPLATLPSGNVYCGWLCPFGALQELAGEFALRYRPSKRLWSFARMGKYFALACLLMLFFGGAASPFLLDANGGVWGGLGLWPLAALSATLLSSRFWCRNLCPTGAFLSLLNKTRMKGLAPAIMPGRCDMGVSSSKEADCLNCGRCRDAKAFSTMEKEPAPLGKAEAVFLSVTALAVLAMALLPLLRR